MKKTTLNDCCSLLKDSANNYLSMCLPSNKLITFFCHTKNAGNTANGLIESIDKYQFRMNFPNLHVTEQTEFITDLHQVYLKLVDSFIQASRSNTEYQNLSKFFNQFCRLFKATIYTLWGGYFLSQKEINLNYVEHYTDWIDCGLDSPSNYELLNQNLLSIMDVYLKSNPNGFYYKMIKSSYDTLAQSEKSVNLYASSHTERFYNMLKFVNPLRHILIDENDVIILPELTRVMDDALEITRSESYRTARAQKLSIKYGDIIDKKIAEHNQISSGTTGVLCASENPIFSHMNQVSSSMITVKNLI